MYTMPKVDIVISKLNGNGVLKAIDFSARPNDYGVRFYFKCYPLAHGSFISGQNVGASKLFFAKLAFKVTSVAFDVTDKCAFLHKCLATLVRLKSLLFWGG